MSSKQIKCTIGRNNRNYYFIDGKRISKKKVLEIDPHYWKRKNDTLDKEYKDMRDRYYDSKLAREEWKKLTAAAEVNKPFEEWIAEHKGLKERDLEAEWKIFGRI